MTNLSDTQQDGHRTGVRTKAQTNNGDSEAPPTRPSPTTATHTRTTGDKHRTGTKRPGRGRGRRGEGD